MKTKKEILKTMKAIGELRLTAINLGVPAKSSMESLELMIEILDWVLKDSDVKQ